MSLRLGELVAYLKTDNKGLRDGLRQGREEVRRGGRDMATEATATAVAMATVLGAGGGRGGERFARDAAGRLRDAHGRFAKSGREAGDALGDAAGAAFRSVFKTLADGAGELAVGSLSTARTSMTNLQTAVTNLSTNVWNLVPLLLSAAPAIAGIGVAAALSVPALSLLGGALGSLPALMFGLGAGVGALGLGFMGLGDHFKDAAASGGSFVDRAYQIARAERQVRDANREVLASTEALSRARETAARRIRDLNSSLDQARLDEEAAVIAVADAERDLAAARTPEEYARRELALRQSRKTLEDIRTRIGDLTAEQEENAREGVEGSEEVTDALDRQRRAVEAVEDAEHALREARRAGGGGGGAAAELTKLAPAAQEVVNVLKSLKPAWESLRLDVQQRLFKGVGGELRLLAQAWLPQLHRSLGGMATMFNGLFRDFAKNARRPEFIRNIGAGIESVQRMLDRIGRSVTGPLLDAFGRLSRAAGPFIEALGDEIGGLIDGFSRWIASADKSGKLESFFDRASGFLRDVFAIGRDVGSIIGSITSILFNSPKSLTESPWDAFKLSMDEIAAWFRDPENQAKIQEWIDRIKDFGEWLINEGIPTVAGWVERVSGWVSRAEEWGDRIKGFRDDVTGAFNSIVTFFDKAPGRISSAVRGLFSGLWSEFRGTLNRIIGAWNGLSFSVGGGTFAGVPVPGMSLRVPQLPYLAKGGHIVRPGAAVVGDAGPEVLELPAGATVRPLSGGDGPAAVAGGLAQLRITGELRARGRDLVLVLREEIADLGGDVQRAVGSNT